MSLPSDTVVLFANIFYSIEFLIDIVVLAVACLNLAVIGTTKLLHPNLKCILITQSVAVVLFVLDRLAMLVPKFIPNNDVFAPTNMILQDFMRLKRLQNSNQIDVAPHSVELANNRRDGTNEMSEHFKTLQQLWNE
ncbi:hypothetical protein GPALN_003349 [Globodera pallida]|nr:hypothetical protein GPALN_003349 [Globodera pallida]